MERIITVILTLALFALPVTTDAQFGKLLDKAKNALKEQDGLSAEEVGKGLKEALEKGVSKGADVLSARNGYYESMYKILLPEAARPVVQKLKKVPGFSDWEQEMIQKINFAAEDAATKAKPIFVDAIRQMTFQDAMNILMGEKDAATQYLHKTTFQPLYNAFKPIIVDALNRQNALDYWQKGMTAYNRLPFVASVNPDLADHVTTKALDGLFAMVETEERQIRENPAQRTTALLKKVFAKQD